MRNRMRNRLYYSTQRYPCQYHVQGFFKKANCPLFCHPERSEGSRFAPTRCFASLSMTSHLLLEKALPTPLVSFDACIAGCIMGETLRFAPKFGRNLLDRVGTVTIEKERL